MTYNNKNQIQKIQQIENLIQKAKSSLKTWANQISKHHKTLKELTSQVETIKSQLNLNQPKNQPHHKTN